MIQERNELIATINGIIQLKYADTEAKMMCINGLMQGHGVTWKPFNTVLIEAATGRLSSDVFAITSGELTRFVSGQDYFIYQVNSGAFGPFSFYDDIEAVCSRCMDFTILEAGNRVNMAENNGPY